MRRHDNPACFVNFATETNYTITQPGQARTKKKKNLPTEMKSRRNELFLFLILRDFNSES